MFDFGFDVKILWKKEVVWVRIDKSSKLEVMFDRIASKIKIERDAINDLKIFLDGRIVKRIYTCQDVGITIRSLVPHKRLAIEPVMVIYVDVRRSCQNGKMTPDVKGMIEVKIQMMLIKPNSPFVIMMADYVEKMEFDGPNWVRLFAEAGTKSLLSTKKH